MQPISEQTAPAMRIAPGTPDVDALVAYLREQRCIAYAEEDGSVEVIPPLHVHPDDDWYVIELVRAWQERQGLRVA
jgi:hypothetical protein